MYPVKPRNGILEITPYKAGDQSIKGVERIIKLASNESPMGPSPYAVIAAKQAAETGLNLYPDPACTALRAAIGEVHDLDPDRIFCSNGSEEILHLVAKGYARDGDEIIISQYGFLSYAIATHAVGATPVMVDEVDYQTNVDGILAAATEKTTIVYLANPNNPTGTYLSHSEVTRLRQGLRDDILLVLDAAYAEYSDAEDFDAGMGLVDNGLENTVVTRTFSKIYGLAGCRVGWAYAPASVLNILHRIRGAFNVSAVSQVAAAAAVRDQNHVKKALAHNLLWLPKMTDVMINLGLEVTPSLGNFLLVHFPEGKFQAAAADTFLRTQGIIVRPVGNYGLAGALRITVGTAEENQAFLSAMQEFMS